MKKEFIKKFENDLDKFLKTDGHNFDCASHSEGQYCCLDSADKGDKPKKAREWIIDWLKQNED